MFLIAVGEQVKIGAKMSEIKIGVAQSHLIKIKHLEVLIYQDVLIMEILVNGNMHTKIKLGGPLD